jgi:hypothetical protein
MNQKTYYVLASQLCKPCWKQHFVAVGFAIHQKGVGVVEMAGYKEDGMVGMMVREEVDCDRIITGRMIVVGNIHCLKTACDQNTPYMAGGGGW